MISCSLTNLSINLPSFCRRLKLLKIELELKNKVDVLFNNYRERPITSAVCSECNFLHAIFCMFLSMLFVLNVSFVKTQRIIK